MNNSIKNDNQIKNLKEKIKIKNLNDEIELKDIKIKENKRKIKEIKEGSLKEFVYANRIIPISWKNKIDYRNQVLEMFARDQDFLSYVGNTGPEDSETNKLTKNNPKYKFKIKNKQRPLSFSPKNNIYNLKDENSLKTKDFISVNNNKNKLKHKKNKTLNEKELHNISDDLKNDYPIKDKLKELFPEDLIKSINLKSKNIDENNNNMELNYLKVKPKKRRNMFRQNIFVNLIPPKTKNKQKRVQSAYSKNGYKNEYNNIFVKKKFNIKDENIMKHLESIHFFGPYYSYCPPCGNRNIDFYKNLDNKKLNQIIQQIKKMRGSKILGNGTERTKINKNIVQL